MDEREIAVEEWKQLQTIIGRFDNLEYQIRGWLLVLIGLLVTALFSEKTQLRPTAFFFIGMFSVATFCSMELVTRRPKRIAIERAMAVEIAISDGHNLNSPRIAHSLSLGPKSTIWDLVSEIGIAQVWTFYLLLSGMVLIVWLIRR